jgi:hypothetical protein
MATPSINNGIFYRQTQFDMRSHVAKNYLPLMNVDTVTDLGPVEYWAMARKSELPLYKMSSFGGKNIREIDGNIARYQVPVSMDDTVEIVADVTTTDKPGIDGSEFEIFVSDGRFGYGDILKFSQFSNFQLVVQPRQIRTRGEGAIYTVKMPDGGNVKYLDKKYLAPGTRIGKYGSVMSPEFGQNYSSWAMKGVGNREYIIKIGEAVANTSYWVSNKANEHGITTANYNKVMEYIQIDGSGDPTVPELTKYMSSVGMSPLDLKKKVENGEARMQFGFAMDDISMKILARDYENQLMWGTGGRIQLDGADEVDLPTGLWQQLNSGYVHVFNMNNFNKQLFINAYHNYFLGRRDLTTPGQEPVVDIDTGWGGMVLVNDMIKAEAGSNSMIVNAKEIGALTGGPFNLGWGLWYNELTLPGLVRLRFKYNPAFDVINKNDIDNPRLSTGYNLSSYSFIMYDVDDFSNNVELLRNKNAKIKMIHEPGRDAHPLFKQDNGAVSRHTATSRKSGFGVAFERPYDAIRVIDPTRILKIVMRNPFTGEPFGGLN